MGRPRKPIQKRISGTGYTKGEAARLKYKKLNKDGTYSIDTEEIGNRVNAYVDNESRAYVVAKRYKNKGKPDEEVTEELDYKPMSVPGLMLALGISKKETLDLWRQGYTNKDHINDETVTYNEELMDAIAQGWLKIGKHLLEDESGKYMSRIRERQAESAGFLTPTKTVNEHTVKIVSDKWKKKAK